MKPVKSTNISALDYDAATGMLTVVFKQGGTYHYHGVSPVAYEALEKAESIGGYFAKHIKPKHKFSKVEDTKK